ncbi:MAG: HAMP domain-containing protein [Pseudomonadota bacterium]
MTTDGNAQEDEIVEAEAKSRTSGSTTCNQFLEQLLTALEAARDGDFSVRLRRSRTGLSSEVAQVFNELMAMNQKMANEIMRVGRVVGQEGRMTERAHLGDVSGAWRNSVDSINTLIGDLVQPTTEVARVLSAVAEGDLSQKMALEIEGRPVKGEFLHIGTTVNTMVDQLSSFASEVTRVAREVGTEGKLGGQAEVKGVSGTWKDLTDNVNFMARNLTDQVRNIAKVTTAVANGDLSQKIAVDARGEILELKNTINTMVDQLSSFASEVTRVAREVGTEGKLGGQAEVKGVSGTWKDLTDNVNLLAGNLTSQVRNIAKVTTAVANGDLSQKITVDVKGEILELKDTINTMVDQLRSFASEVTRVAREVGTEGKLGGQAEVKGVSGTWKDLTDNVNLLAGNLTDQVRNIAKVTTAVANGDLSQKITVDARGEILELKSTINTMVDQLSSFASEVTRVAREVGTEGKLGGQAEVKGVSGTWKDLTDNVNFMARNLTDQVRNIAKVTTAVANGDLSQKITVDVKGEILELKDTINTMVDQLSSFASEVTRVAREVGTEGKLGGQAEVKGVSGTWKDLTDNVNFMASNLTAQVRGIARVVTAVANGDLKQKLAFEAKGEIAALADTINSMTETLSIFAEQVTTVAREVGIEGKLGGQAKVPGAAGTWKDLTDNVNQLAGNLTAQVRAIADVATAVTKGDLTRSITVEAQGEVAELKDNINHMIGNLKDTTQKNMEQDWLKTNLAKFSRMMQGQKDLAAVSRLIMSELTPLVSAHHGAFFVMDAEDEQPALKLIASYAYKERKHVSNSFRLGEGLVGQCALENQSILLTKVPSDYIQINSGLGEAAPLNIIVLPVPFEGRVKAVIELASFQPFSDIHQIFLDQLMESIGVVLNMIKANMRTEELLQELQRSNVELEAQAKELEDKATLLEIKNKEVELASLSLEEKAEQLSLISKYKSEFLANMSHELRTPLNSLMILAKLLAENRDGNLSEKQVEFANTIYSSGHDLLALINEILDLSKVESGKMGVEVTQLPLQEVGDSMERGFRQMAQQKGLRFAVQLEPDLPRAVYTDAQRMQQILRNLLSNAFKFTEAGQVVLHVSRAEPGVKFDNEVLRRSENVLAFSVSDTGIGIPKSKQRLIFEAFQQADGTTSRKYGGTGLGLTISRELARLLGGEIHIDSVPGRGSTFTLYLPQIYQGIDTAAASGAAHASAETEAATLVSAVLEAEYDAMPAMDIADDREQIQPGDRVFLIIENDPNFARILLGMARENGFKGLVALDGESGLALAHRYRPDAITLDLKMPVLDGWAVLERLKSHPHTRHIPVHVISVVDRDLCESSLGAVAYLQKPVSREVLEGVFNHIACLLEREVKSVLVVEDNDIQRDSIVEFFAGEGVQAAAFSCGMDALAELSARSYDCMVLDLMLPDMSGAELLARLKNEMGLRNLPVVIYTSKDLTSEEERQLRELADSIIIKDADSAERLLSEAALCMRRAAGPAPVVDAAATAVSLSGRKVLVVDDDARNIFALASVLENHDIEILYAENGRDGIDTLEANPDIDLILMDVMMPEMDGYETMRAIRAIPAFRDLPIIALTAKAMPGDREKCIDAGASDYITKPVDTDQLLALMRAWVKVA